MKSPFARSTLLTICFLSAITCCTALAVEPEVELLWPQGAPGAKGDQPADKPTLTIYLPEACEANGMAIP